MKKETYIKYIKYTLSTYNMAHKKAIIKLYKDLNLVKKKDVQQSLFDNEIVEIDYNDLDGTILRCIEKNDEAIRIYEEYQFTKSYRYAVLLKSDDFEDIMKKINNIPDYQYNDEIKLYDNLSSPSKKEIANDIIILFNKKFEAVHPLTREELLLHYPLLLVVHKDSKIIEVRFDTVKQVFVSIDRDQTIYVKMIREVFNYFKEQFDIELKPLDLTFIKGVVDNDELKNVNIVSQYMCMKNGTKAQLSIGDNEEYVLPIIGELKNIMNEFNEELEKNIKIKDALEQFIYEKEETTDYPWIEVSFLDDEGIKTRNNHVKFTFNYMNTGCCLITYYNNDTLIGMERMNNVTRFT